MSNQTIKGFNKKLHTAFMAGSDEMDMDDTACCISALLVKYGVKYKDPADLDEDLPSTCDSSYKGDIEAHFMDHINSKAHDNFETFNRSCMQFLDYSGALFMDKKGYIGFTARVFSMMEETFLINTKAN